MSSKLEKSQRVLVVLVILFYSLSGVAGVTDMGKDLWVQLSDSNPMKIGRMDSCKNSLTLPAKQFHTSWKGDLVNSDLHELSVAFQTAKLSIPELSGGMVSEAESNVDDLKTETIEALYIKLKLKFFDERVKNLMTPYFGLLSDDLFEQFIFSLRFISKDALGTFLQTLAALVSKNIQDPSANTIPNITSWMEDEIKNHFNQSSYHKKRDLLEDLGSGAFKNSLEAALVTYYKSELKDQFRFTGDLSYIFGFLSDIIPKYIWSLPEDQKNLKDLIVQRFIEWPKSYTAQIIPHFVALAPRFEFWTSVDFKDREDPQWATNLMDFLKTPPEMAQFIDFKERLLSKDIGKTHADVNTPVGVTEDPRMLFYYAIEVLKTVDNKFYSVPSWFKHTGAKENVLGVVHFLAEANLEELGLLSDKPSALMNLLAKHLKGVEEEEGEDQSGKIVKYKEWTESALQNLGFGQ